MKSLYFLTPTLSSSHDVTEDLHEVGVKDFYVHVISKNEAGLKQQQIHSSNYLETLNIVRDGFIGGIAGLIVGVGGVSLLMYLDPFGPDVQVPTFVYLLLVGVATLFGAWEGGLMGVDNENRKLARFHDDIAAGKYLILVYVRKAQEAAVRDMMKARRPEAQLVGIDSHVINPFASVKRIPEDPAQTA
jgi:hypothetical protein